MLDGKRLSAQFYRLVPVRYEDDFQFVFSTINRTFGGFLRGQVLMALLQGLFTGLLMRIFGLQLTMLTAILSGFLMFIPELGAPVAMLMPSAAAVLQGSDAAIPLLIIMLTFQQILLRFVIPKILSEAIGMPPLLILLSVLVSAKVMGLWGFFFGIPVAGAIYTITVVSLEELKQATDAQDRARREGETAGRAFEPFE
jgi:predicted PurR-regulated permease PerM